MNALQKRLKDLGMCPEAVQWAAGFTNINEAWKACPRGDWLLWLGARLGYNRKDLVLAACDCARIALPVSQGQSSVQAISAAEKWASGERPAPSKSLSLNVSLLACKLTNEAKQLKRDSESAGNIHAAAHAAFAASAAARAATYEDVPYAPQTAAGHAVYALEVSSKDRLTTRKRAHLKTADLVRHRLSNKRISELLASHTLHA